MTDWSKIISAGVGPIIVISACGLLCLAFYNRLAAVVTRLRAFDRERLAEHRNLTRARAQAPQDEGGIVHSQEVIGMLEMQSRHVLVRAKLVQRVILFLLITILIQSVTSLTLGLSTIVPWFTYIATVCFIVGLMTLVIGVMFALVELKHALDPVELEGRFMRSLAEEFDQPR